MNDTAEHAHAELTRLINWAEAELDNEHTDRQYLIEDLLDRLDDLRGELKDS